MTDTNGFWPRIKELWARSLFEEHNRIHTWEAEHPHKKSFWYEVASDGLASLDIPETELALKWILSGISEPTICQMLMVAVKAREYKKERRRLLDSITDPVLRKAAMR